MKKTSAIIFLLLLQFLIGCSEDNNPVDTVGTVFKLIFSNGYNSGQGYVILYSEDGNTAVDTRSFFGNSTIDFGELTEERVNFTIICLRSYNDDNYYYITSYYSAPKGEWTFDGRNTSHKGGINLDIYFPYGEYDQCFIGTSDISTRRGLYSATDNYQYNTDYIYYLTSDNTFNLYSSVYNYDNGVGFCDWQLDLPFSIGTTNNFTMNLSQPLNASTFTANKEFDYISIYGLLGDKLDRLRLFYDYTDFGFQTTLFLPNNFPAQKYRTFVSYLKDNIQYDYAIISNSPVTSVDFPSDNINSHYDENTFTFSNISITGSADEILAEWYFRDIETGNYYYWDVLAPVDFSTIKRPSLPSSVFPAIGNLNIYNLENDGISIIDYDVTSNMDEIITMFHKSDIIPENYYSSFYRYTSK